MAVNIIKHSFSVSRTVKEQKSGTKGTVLWLTGLSGSGKSTIANKLEKILVEQNKRVQVIDGDSLRSGLCRDLGFSIEDRDENLRRAAEVAKLFVESGNITICCFVTPLEGQRERVREILGEDFHLIYVNASLEECESRDPKGLYKKAREGKIKEFTGIDSIYESPKNADLVVEAGLRSPADCAEAVSEFYLSLTN